MPGVGVPGVIFTPVVNSLTPLMDFSNLGSGREGEAAHVGLSGEWLTTSGWNDGGNSGPASSRTTPTDLTMWTDVATPVETTGVSDPFGGTNAFTTQDNDSTHNEGHTYQMSPSVSAGVRYRYRIWILKASTTLSCEFGFTVGSSEIRFNLWPGGGEYEETHSGHFNIVTTVETAPEDSDWWRISCEFNCGDSGTATFRFFPGMGPLRFTTSTVTNFFPNPTSPTSTYTTKYYNTYNPTTGVCTWYPPVLEAHASMKGPDEPRKLTFPSGLDAVLCEPAINNEMPFGGFYEVANWTKTNATVTQNQTGPDGITYHGWTLEDTSTSSVGTVSDGVGYTGTGFWTFSIYIKKDSDTSRFPEIRINESGAVFTGGDIAVQINTQTGATNTRDGTPEYVTVRDVDADWWRLIICFDVTTASLSTLSLCPAAGTTIGSLNSSATGTAVFGPCQMESGAFATSWFPNYDNNNGARAQDVDTTVPNADIDSDVFNTGFKVDYYPLYAAEYGPSSTAEIYRIDGGDYVSRNQSGTNTRMRFRANGGGNQFIDSSHASLATLDKLTSEITQADTEHELFLNDVSEGSDNDIGSGDDWGPESASDIDIGNDTGGNSGCGYISVAYSGSTA